MTNETDPGTVDIRGIALSAIKRCRQAGESQEMLARWISEDVNRALAAQSQPAATVQEVGREVLAKAAQIAGDAIWNLPAPKDWEGGKAEYINWCARQSKFVKEKIAALAEPAAKAGDAEYGWVFYGPDGEWWWSDKYACHEAITDQRPATMLEKMWFAHPPSPQPDMGSVEAIRVAIDRWMPPGADEARKFRLYDEIIAALSPPTSQSVEKMKEALNRAAQIVENCPDSDKVRTNWPEYRHYIAGIIRSLSQPPASSPQEEIATIGSHIGNGGMFDPTSAAGGEVREIISDLIQIIEGERRGDIMLTVEKARALLSTEAGSGEVRERIARIIDPGAWESRDWFDAVLRGDHVPADAPEKRAMLERSAARRKDTVVAPSLEKADAILAALSTEAGRHPCPDILREDHNEAVDWITANCMAIRRDNGDMDYSLGAMIAAYEAGKAAIAEAGKPAPSTIDATMLGNPGWQAIEQVDRDALEAIRKSDQTDGALLTVLVAHRMASQPAPAEPVAVTSQSVGLNELAHEIWAMAQVGPGEGIEDAVSRIVAALAEPAAKAGDAVEPLTQREHYDECQALLTKHHVQPTLSETNQGPPTIHFVGIVNAMLEFANKHRLAPPSPQPDMGSGEAIGLIGEASFAEVVDCDFWSLQLHFGKGEDARDKMRAVSDALRALSTLRHKEEATPPPVGEQGAVAWMYEKGDRTCLWRERAGPGEMCYTPGWTETPLYAHPLPEQPREGYRYRRALEEIKRAVIDGKVCDDVPWFDSITTLYDFIDMVLDPPEPPVFRDLFPSTETKESGE